MRGQKLMRRSMTIAVEAQLLSGGTGDTLLLLLNGLGLRLSGGRWPFAK